MNHVLIIAGEASGDALGAGFVEEFLKIRPAARFFGLGGDKMAAAGVDLEYHIKDLAFLGFWEVIKNIPFIWRVEKHILKKVDKVKPPLAVLIDYPGFNLRLARKLNKRNVKIFYFVSPQIWAWGAGRISKIKKHVDLMTTIFEFEKDIYEKAGVPVRWVGYPMIDKIKPDLSDEEFRRRAGIAHGETAIGLFPGSRIQEIERILPAMLLALKSLSAKHSNIKGVIGRAPAIERLLYEKMLAGYFKDAIILDDLNYDLMAHAKINIVCSGTATLECAIIGTPLLVVYKTSLPTYWIARRLIKIPYIGMVNVVVGEKIVPELVQSDCSPEKIAQACLDYLNNEAFYTQVKSRLSSIKNKLGQPGAAGRAAESAVLLMESPEPAAQ